MTKNISTQHHATFESIRQTDEAGNAFWSARQLSKVLEYSQYRHFLPVMEKAREACANSGQQVADHMEDILHMVEIGSGAQRKVEDVRGFQMPTVMKQRSGPMLFEGRRW